MTKNRKFCLTGADWQMILSGSTLLSTVLSSENASFFFFNCLMSKEADSSVYIYEAWAAGAGFLCLWLFHLGKSNQTPSENWCMMSWNILCNYSFGKSRSEATYLFPDYLMWTKKYFWMSLVIATTFQFWQLMNSLVSIA